MRNGSVNGMSKNHRATRGVTGDLDSCRDDFERASRAPWFPFLGNNWAAANVATSFASCRHTLADIVGVEPEFYPIIQQQQRPYYLFWIDHKHDQPSDVLNRYIQGGGTAKCSVLIDDVGRSSNVTLPYHCRGSVPTPRLPGNIADAFYRGRLPLDQAIQAGRMGEKMALAERFKNFIIDLGSAL